MTPLFFNFIPLGKIDPSLSLKSWVTVTCPFTSPGSASSSVNGGNSCIPGQVSAKTLLEQNLAYGEQANTH